MKQLLMIAALACLAFSADAQTRRIAHRFHSGTDTERYDNNDGSYGAPYIPRVYVLKTDTIRPTGKDSAFRLVDSSYYQLDTTNRHQPRSFKDMNNAQDYGKICSRYTGQ